VRRFGPVTIVAVATLAGVLSGCAQFHHRTTGHASGGKAIAIDLSYRYGLPGMGVQAYADIADHTAGTVEVTGPQHWRCQGQFRAHTAADFVLPWDIEAKPWFVPDGAPGGETNPGLMVEVPPGSYTVTLRIPAVHAELKQSASIENPNGPDPSTGLPQHDPGCVLIADTAAQQKAVIAQYLSAMHLRAREFGKQDLRDLVAQAQEQFASANQATDPAAIQARYSEVARTLAQFKDAVRTDFPDLPPMHVIWATEDAIALLSQSGLS
jgi:hypothetical protein